MQLLFGPRHTALAARFPSVSRMPFSIRVLLEAMLRNIDGFVVTNDDVAGLAGYDASGVNAVAFFTEHVPTEVEATAHYLKDKVGTDIEPAAELAYAHRLLRRVWRGLVCFFADVADSPGA